ncbi:TonB-dependent receptor plug domain-containing protein [Ottowia testudinis]|uniref:TonB-dependent receptor plug domain-containing protein n=1 Tax=Ottowia testudinis TaxID=2816950 RepID=UPI001FB12E25|nr:TonB-dependent receptor [Ottowia testudinis]
MAALLACAGVASAQTATSDAPSPDAAAKAASEAGVPATSLPQVTVTATKHEQEVRAAPASVTVVGRDAIQDKASDDLMSVIEEVPGLTLSPRQVSGRKTFSLRGMDSRHTLMLIDGRRISASDDVVGHSNYQYGWVPLSAVERVEVIRGPLSALYGSEALGGVVNVITRWPTDQWEGSVRLSGQRAGAHAWGGDGGKAAVYVGGPVGQGLSVRLNAETGRTGAIADRDSPRYSEIEGRQATTGGIAARYQPNARHSFEAGWQQGREERRYDDVDARSRKPYENLYTLDRSHGYAQWNGQFGEVTTQLRAYRSAIDVKNARTNGVAPTRPQDLKDVVGDGFAQWRMGAHRITVGGEWRRESLVNAGLKGGKDAASHQALFAQDEISLGSNLVATLGGRLDRHEYFGSQFSPRAYLVWEATPQLIVKGGFGSAFKAPTLKQVSPNYVGAEGPHTFRGNENVKPETSRSFEIGADWQSGPFALRGTLFHTRVKDLITVRLLGVQGTRRDYLYDNVNRATMRGAELGFAWAFGPGLKWNNDLTLLRTRDDATGKELTDRPRHVLHSQVQWQNAGGWNARLGVDFTGSQRTATGSRLPSYTVVGASVGQQINKMLSWRAGIDNLGDVRLSEKSADFGYALRGRTYHVSLRADF